MDYRTFEIEPLTALTAPHVIVGFRGWGNALDVASGAAVYLVETLGGAAAGRLQADACFRYDENRPVVHISGGKLEAITPPGGVFYALPRPAGEGDLLILVADEPQLNWYRFTRELVELSTAIGAASLISLGSMFDSVLHTDHIISGIATGEPMREMLSRHAVTPVDYHGPSAIHTLLLEACRKRGIPGASLWCHCPAYLQGVIHHGMVLALVRLLARILSVDLPTDDLETRWKALSIQIEKLAATNPKIGEIMDKIRREQRTAEASPPQPGHGHTGTVINLGDYLNE